MTTIAIPKIKIQREKGVVILPLDEYRRLCESAVPTYYLEGKAAKDLDKLVKKGLEDCRKGKCKTIKSLADLD